MTTTKKKPVAKPQKKPTASLTASSKNRTEPTSWNVVFDGQQYAVFTVPLLKAHEKLATSMAILLLSHEQELKQKAAKSKRGAKKERRSRD